MSDMKYGQDVMNPEITSGSMMAGFNRRVSGWPYTYVFQHHNERINREMHAGWNLANKMIKDGRLFYIHNFHSLECKDGYAFPYGGTWVCNTCCKDHLEKEWWKIKVYIDGNAWLCVGIDFENLQESKNYAFGDTRQEAIQNYGKTMITQEDK